MGDQADYYINKNAHPDLNYDNYYNLSSYNPRKNYRLYPGDYGERLSASWKLAKALNLVADREIIYLIINDDQMNEDLFNIAIETSNYGVSLAVKGIIDFIKETYEI